MDVEEAMGAPATGTALVESAENNDSSSSTVQITDPSLILAAMQRKGRHRKSDAAVDAAIFSMLLTGRHLTAMTVHRELLKNPKYNLSERTVRRRMNEFFEFQRANSLSSSADQSQHPDFHSANAKEDQSSNAGMWNSFNTEGTEGGVGYCGDTCDSPISSLQRLFAYTEGATASSDLFNTDFEHNSLSPSAQSPREEGSKEKQPVSGLLETRLVKGEDETGQGVRSMEELFTMMAPNHSHFINASEASVPRRRPYPSDSIADGVPPPQQHQNVADSSSESHSSRCHNASSERTDASNRVQNENQAELVDEGRSDGGEDLKERLEAEFVSLSHEALDEFMREVEGAVQQHRKQMASKAALLMNELPPAKKRQLLERLKTTKVETS